MSISISPSILGLTGQRVNEITLNKHHKAVHILCKRDKRRKVIDPLTGQKGTINRFVKRQVLRNRVRSLASSTAIETGEPIEKLEAKIRHLHSCKPRITLA